MKYKKGDLLKTTKETFHFDKDIICFIFNVRTNNIENGLAYEVFYQNTIIYHGRDFLEKHTKRITKC